MFTNEPVYHAATPLRLMPGQDSPWPQSRSSQLENSTRSGVLSPAAQRHCYAAFFLGTLAPFLRASDRPIAIACFRLFTFPPFPPRPERRLPRFFRRIALATVFPALLLYLRPRDFFLAGIPIPFLFDNWGLVDPFAFGVVSTSHAVWAHEPVQINLQMHPELPQ